MFVIRWMPVIAPVITLAIIIWITGMGRGWWDLNPFRPRRRENSREEE